jgi:hypothetical protein
MIGSDLRGPGMERIGYWIKKPRAVHWAYALRAVCASTPDSELN